MTACKHVAFFLAGTLILAGTGCDRALRFVTGIRSLEPRLVSAKLTEPDPPLVLDVRNREDYREGHVPGSLSIQPQDVEAFVSRLNTPPGRTVIVVCSSGDRSPVAAASAAAWHRGPVLDVEGGMNAWRQAGLPLERGPGEPVPAAALAIRAQDMGRIEQGIAYVLAALIKPGYMLFCLALILILARARAWARSAALPLRLLFWGLVLFDLGETFCALDFYTRAPGKMMYPLDLLHGAGMVGMGVFMPWALFRLADDRILRYADPRQPCAIQRFCGACWKRQDATCALHRLFLWSLPALAILCLIPFTLPLRPIHYLSNVFSTPVEYGPPILNELVETRGYALLGALSFMVSFFILRGGPGSTRRAEFPFFLGIGFFGFALFRFFLHSSFSEALNWSDFWEEITELIAIAWIGLLLFLYRSQLGLAHHRPGSPGDAQA